MDAGVPPERQQRVDVMVLLVLLELSRRVLALALGLRVRVRAQAVLAVAHLDTGSLSRYDGGSRVSCLLPCPCQDTFQRRCVRLHKHLLTSGCDVSVLCASTLPTTNSSMGVSRAAAMAPVGSRSRW